MIEIMGKVEERTPYVIVAFQECQRMNILTNELKQSLKELDLGLKVITKKPFTMFTPTLSLIIY
jgi:dynein heavy chain